MDEKAFIAGRQHGKTLERAKVIAELLSIEGIKPGEFFVLDSYAGVGNPKTSHWMDKAVREMHETEYKSPEEYKSPAELRGDFRKGLNDMMKKGRGRR